MTTLPENVNNEVTPAVGPPSDAGTDGAVTPRHERLPSLGPRRTRERHGGGNFSGDGRSRRPTVSVVIPALNEEKNIAWVLERMPPIVDEVILADGHSSDRTVEVARGIRSDIVVVPQHFRGKGDAVRVALAIATSDLIVMMDADGSMDPSEIYHFVTPLLNGYDFVKGSRFLVGGESADLTTLRRLGNQALVRMTNTMFLVRFTDLCYGFCSFRRSCVPELAPTAHGFEIETELVVRALKVGLRIAEVPSSEMPRRCGASNLHALRDGLRVLRTLVRERVVRSPRPVVDPIDTRVLWAWRLVADNVRGELVQRTTLTEKVVP